MNSETKAETGNNGYYGFRIKLIKETSNKMENTRQEFHTEVNKLLSSYLNKKELKSFQEKIGASTKKQSAGDVINNFYAKQLKVEYELTKDRMEIDRSITYAKKNLEKNQYLNFLRTLGQICTAHGKSNMAFEILNNAVRESGNAEDKAQSLFLLSDVHSRKAEWRKSIDVLGEAKRLFESACNKNGSSKCENLLGVIFAEKGELEEAKVHFILSLSLIDRENEKETAASIESNIGIIENIQGNYSAALKYFDKALRKFETLGNHRRMAELKHNIGMLHMNRKDIEHAMDEFDQCIEISLNEGLLPVLGLVYLSKANLLVEMGNPDSASTFADKSLEVCHKTDDKLTTADVYRVKSLIEKKLGNYDKAENYLQSSLRINQKLNNALNIAETYFELAVLNGELNRNEEKEELLKAALSHFNIVQAFERIAQVEAMLNPTTNCN